MRFRLVVNGEAHEVETDGGVTVDGHRIGGRTTEGARGLTVHIGRKRYRLFVTRWGSIIEGVSYRVEVRDLERREVSSARATGRSSVVGRVEVRPPMPGRIVRVGVKVGDRVARYEPLAVLEAMKMQNEVPAPVAGVVEELRVNEGQRVLASDVIVVLRAA